MIASLALATALLSQQVEEPIASIQITTTAGKTITVPDPKAKATVLVFLLTDCPIANRYAPELKRIESDYKDKGVVFVRVYPYKDATLDSIAEHTKQFEYKSPAVLDKDHVLVKATLAKVTPEVAVITPEGVIQYRGRIDDWYIEHGRLRETEYRHDLRIAIDEVLKGKPVTVPRAPAIGCFIEG